VKAQRASGAQLPRAAEVLARAFEADPAWGHMLPDPSSRPQRLRRHFDFEIGHLPRTSEVWVTEDGDGAAVWAQPGHWRASVWQALRSWPAAAAVFGRRLPAAARAQRRNERLHPDEESHWYLHYLGVIPERQGRGLGAALIAPVLELCDSSALPAYLEASTVRNAALYQRHGFALAGIHRMPGNGPELRRMWREPRET
jgi:GNAT superfamily N-acetyltransferase